MRRQGTARDHPSPVRTRWARRSLSGPGTRPTGVSSAARTDVGALTGDTLAVTILEDMLGRHPAPVRIIGDAPGAADALTYAAADPEVRTVLVHREGVEFAEGAIDRLVAALHRPHRRLVRVHGPGSCYLAGTEVVSAALRQGITAAEFVADDAGLDHRIAAAIGLGPLDGTTPIEDPATGRWRWWVDGVVVGVRGHDGVDTADDDWARGAARRHGPAAKLTALARRRAGVVRREFVRRRQRPQPR